MKLLWRFETCNQGLLYQTMNRENILTFKVSKNFPNKKNKFKL